MPDQHDIPSPHLPNLRDVGAPDESTPIRHGVLYRSAAPVNPAIRSDPKLAALKISTVLDLRTDSEVATFPDQLPPDADYHHVDILATAPRAGAVVPSLIATKDADPNELLRALNPNALMLETYRWFVTDSVARAGFASTIRSVLEADGAPVLVHCTAGKDRTGWAIATLMAIADESLKEIQREYLSVQSAVLHLFQPEFDHAAKYGVRPEVIRPFYEVNKSFLNAALSQIDADFGGIEGYLRDGLGLAADELTGVRSILTRR